MLTFIVSVWALGVIFFEMAMIKHPFNSAVSISLILKSYVLSNLCFLGHSAHIELQSCFCSTENWVATTQLHSRCSGYSSSYVATWTRMAYWLAESLPKANFFRYSWKSEGGRSTLCEIILRCSWAENVTVTITFFGTILSFVVFCSLGDYNVVWSLEKNMKSRGKSVQKCKIL